ncbi:spore maturation protein [Bacteroidetes bacterium UKL13-3]|jgi:spore maturation protein SpmA|nr:spore maturation protein [Bacteroidetes bacterium UKL13-3]HCP92719.1 spore maturation protein [Bacteroidota bacterium]
MALSRFWSYIIVCSVVYIFFMLGTGRLYTLSSLVNGKQNDPTIIAELSSSTIQQSDTALYAALMANKTANSATGDTLYNLLDNGIVQICAGKQAADGIFPTCKNTIMDIWLPLIGYLTFFCGLLNLLNDSNAITKLARVLSPFFVRVFPELPKGHPAYGFMTMNFAANFLGLDNAATPFGLKAMESMQEVNETKERASNSQIMFLCLHAAGLTLIPTSIIGYRAAQNATNPADIMLPCIITSFIGTLAALIFVSIKQRINLLNIVVLGFVTGVSAIIGFLLFYVNKLSGIEKFHFTGNLSNGVLLFIILAIVAYSIWQENIFKNNQTNIFDSFVNGAKDGFTTGVRVLPYMIAMLVALSIFRNSDLMRIIMSGLSTALNAFGVDPQIIQAIPVAIMRPFSAGGSRGFMLDAMKTYGPDSLAGQLSCLFQGAAETTFYVIALYFGSVNVKETRYTLGIMLLVDLVCVITAIFVCKIYF